MKSKHKAMLDYLAQYPGLNAFLRFNSIPDNVGNVSIQSISSDTWEEQDITGHGVKRYDFAIITVSSQDSGTSFTNVEQMQAIQDFMDWIQVQNMIGNLPEFPGCDVQSIENLQNMPNLAGVNPAGNAAKYIFQCRVRYYE